MSVTSNLQWVLRGLLAVVSCGANAQEWNIKVSPEAACPTATQLGERLQARMAMAPKGRWGLVVTRFEAEVLNVELTRDGQLIGRRKLTTVGAACPDVAQTVALLVSSWVSSTAQAPLKAESPAATATLPKPPARQRVKRSVPKPEETPGPASGEEEIEAVDLSSPAEVAPSIGVVKNETPVTPAPKSGQWALRATLGAHWTSGFGAQAGLAADVGTDEGWGVRVAATVRTPVTAALAGGHIGWWGGDAVVGFRFTQDFFSIAQWEWALLAGGRFTALVPSGFDEPNPRVVFAPLAGLLLGARVPLTGAWSLTVELGVTAQPWEERWFVLGAGAVPVSWLAGSLSVGVQRAFF